MAATSPLPPRPVPNDEQEIVAANIRALMGRHRLNEKTLAEAVGMDYSGLCRRLNGKTNLTVRELGLISRYFGKQMEDLVTLGKQTKAPLELVFSSPPSRDCRTSQQLPLMRSVRTDPTR